jgi:putative SOS response-associated peptidase YedK
MCGRYALYGPRSRTRAEHRYFDGLSAYPDTYNVAPSQVMPVVRLVDGEPRVTPAKWGLVPCWAKDWKIGYKMINARSETLATSKAYGTPYRRKQRCLVPASGFYEWRRHPGGKQPWYITSADDALLAFAGLLEHWKAPDGAWLTTYTVVTGEPNALVRELHERMPVILAPDDYAAWLEADDPRELLKPCPVEALRAYPVGARVNNPANNDASLMDALRE